MTRERTKELLPVLQAWADGKEIQASCQSANPVWETYQGRDPNFTPESWIWRVKPEPREFWIASFPDGSMRPYVFSDRPTFTGIDRLIRVREVL